jgi:hypothetical protein
VSSPDAAEAPDARGAPKAPSVFAHPRTRVVALGVLAAAAAFFLFGGFSGTSGRTVEPIDAVPQGAFLAASVNLAELRRSPLHDVLLGSGSSEPGRPGHAAPLLDAKALGIGNLAAACGFDPIGRVERLAVGVPEEGDKGELGVAAQINVTRDELGRCTDALAAQRGGKVETKEIDGFTVLEPSSGGEGPRPRLAYGHGGLLVVGRGAWFEAMLAAADKKRPSVAEAKAHAALRRSLTSREGWRAPTFLVTALLPRALRDRIKSEMGAEVGAKDSSQAIMGGVLGVSSVGLALRAGASGQAIDAVAELVCDSEEGCDAVEKLILRKRFEWSKELTLRMVGFGPLLDSIEVKRVPLPGLDPSGPTRPGLRVSAGAPSETLASTLERVLRLTGAGQARPRLPEPDGPSPGAPPSPALPSSSAAGPGPKSRGADETIPARPDAAPPVDFKPKIP